MIRSIPSRPIDWEQRSELGFPRRESRQRHRLRVQCAGGDSYSICRDRIFPGENWRIRIDAFNPGDLPLTNWSYDIELVDLQNGERTPVVTQVAGTRFP